MTPKLNQPNQLNQTARERDLELWQAWKDTGSKQHFNQLLHQLTPVMYSEVHRASGTLPTPALAAEAKKWTITAIHNYDPSRGTALTTHVMNYLPKVRRMNYKYQNAVRLPENQQLKFHDYNRAITQLSDSLNREPTNDEIATHLGWSKGVTAKFKNSLYADLIESASERPAEFTEFNQSAILMRHMMSQLTPDEKIIFDESAKKTPIPEVAAKLKVNVNRYNYLKRKLTEKMLKIKTEIEMNG